MRKALLIITLSLSALTGRWAAAGPLVPDLLGQLSRDDYQGYVNTLAGFGSRYYSGTANGIARDYLTNTFSSFGLSVTNNNTYRNVVATLPGLTTPDQIFVIGGHFDSVPASPGADDNASGTAALLEIASVFSQYRFSSTIQFIAFNAEENGLYGSADYAANAVANQQKIVGMLNLDMIAYDGDNADDVNLYGDASLVDRLAANLIEYNIGLTAYKSYTNPRNSDHYWFNSSQYRFSGFTGSSMMTIERGLTPYYHTAGDTVSTLDWDFALKVTQVNAATLAELALLVPEPPILLLVLPGLIAVAARRMRALTPRRQELRSGPAPNGPALET